jgi:NADH dehydrogenase (ubiquinone) Fe-S protein 1
VLNASVGWNGFNVLHKEISRVGALDIGISPSPPENLKKSKFVYILGADNDIQPEDIPTDAFVVYQGTNGDEGAYYADIILPGAAYTEKDGNC